MLISSSSYLDWSSVSSSLPPVQDVSSSPSPPHPSPQSSSTNIAPSTTGNLSLVAGSSQTTTTTSITTSSSSIISSNVSGNSQFSSASSGDDRGPSGQVLPHSNLKTFTFAELKSATKNFRPDTILGEGGFGKVYKGRIEEKNGSKYNSNASVVAIKKLNSESMQGVEEWQVWGARMQINECVNIHDHDWVREGPLWNPNIAYNLSNEENVVIEISSDEEDDSDN